MKSRQLEMTYRGGTFTILAGLSVSLVFSLAAPAFGLDAATPAWRLTLNERVERRLSLTSERNIGHSATKPVTSVTIMGEEAPELLMPSELFQRFIRLSFASDPRVRALARNDFETRALENGVALPSDFWSTIERASRGYKKHMLASEDYERSVMLSSKRPSNAELATRYAEAQQASCSLTLQSITAARNALGGDTLDRFLYAAVAPTTFVKVLDPEDSQILRSREEGCK